MELELNILNAITKHQRLALDFISNCDESLFSDNFYIAKAIISYIKTYKSKPTPKALLDIHSKNTDFCEVITEFFEKINDEEYNEADYNFEINKLKHIFAERRLEKIQQKLNSSNITDVSENVKFIQQELGAIKNSNSVKTYERSSIKDYASTFRKNYIEKVKNPDMGRGILTGYSMFDYIRNGLKPADLIIIAGETGSGKSMFLLNMAVQIYMQKNTVHTPTDQFTKGYNVAYFSLEMPYDDCYRRTLSRIADVPSYGIRDAKLTKAEAKGLSDACKFTERYPSTFDIIDVPRGFSVEQLELQFEELKNNYPVDCIFIDYLGLMEDINNDDDADWLKLGQLAGKVHEFARAYSIPVLTAVQMNRIDPAQRKKSGVGLHRIGRSSMIAHHATAILQIEARENEETYSDFIYWIIKNRDGENMKKSHLTKKFSSSSLLDVGYAADNKENNIPETDISASFRDIMALLANE